MIEERIRKIFIETARLIDDAWYQAHGGIPVPRVQEVIDILRIKVLKEIAMDQNQRASLMSTAPDDVSTKNAREASKTRAMTSYLKSKMGE